MNGYSPKQFLPIIFGSFLLLSIQGHEMLSYSNSGPSDLLRLIWIRRRGLQMINVDGGCTARAGAGKQS